MTPSYRATRAFRKRGFISRLSDLIWPPRSLLSEEIVDRPGVIESKLWGELKFLNDPLCARCGFPLPDDVGPGAVCAACAGRKPAYDSARASLAYDDNARRLILDLKRGEFHYVSAGHPSPIHVGSDGRAIALAASGFPIGVVEDGDYSERAVTLKPGDRIYLYSDGVTEAFDSQGEQFGTQQLIAVLMETRDRDLSESLEEVLRRLETWRGSPCPLDDVSLVAVELV